MDINYRKAQGEDVVRLVDLMQQLGYKNAAADVAVVLQSIRRREGEVFVADLNGTMVGCVNAIIDVRLAEGVSGEIASLVVSDGYRGRGIGRALVAVAESWLKDRVTNIRIRANTTRTDAHEFYGAMGYASVKEQKIFQQARVTDAYCPMVLDT